MIKSLKYLAILSLLGFPVAVILYRLNIVEFSVSALISGVAVIISVIVFFISIVTGFVMRKNTPKAHLARMAALIAVLPILAVGTQVFTARGIPVIHNISTDTVNPPVFDKVVSLRNEDDNPHEYDAGAIIDKDSGATLAELQRAAYPNVTTLMSDLPKPQAHAKAKSVAESLGWKLVNSDIEAGIIEATETTMIWGFKDDVVVRISRAGDKTAIDVHSVSRLGKSDLGVNAKRIETFLSKFKG